MESFSDQAHATVFASLTSASLSLAAARSALPDLQDCGGYVAFEGIVRNHNHGKSVDHLVYEAYEPLAEKEMRRIAAEAAERFKLRHVELSHRVGSLAIGDVAVIVQVLSHHRAAAFDGCRYIIDELKVRVPIWKKEFYRDGSHEWTRCNHHQVKSPVTDADVVALVNHH